MRILGIDTATRNASVGICEGDAILIEITERQVRSHASLILPLVERVLSEAGITAGEIDAIAVSRGPGSFTGLRISSSIAKGLACATGGGVVGVSTLEALARAAAGRRRTVWTLLDARKGEVYAASFAVDSTEVRRLSEDAVMTPETVAELMDESCAVVGDVEARYGAVLREQVGPNLEFLPFDQFGPRGGIVAVMGGAAVREGRSVDPILFEPSYLRPSDAERLYG